MHFLKIVEKYTIYNVKPLLKTTNQMHKTMNNCENIRLICKLHYTEHTETIEMFVESAKGQNKKAGIFFVICPDKQQKEKKCMKKIFRFMYTVFAAAVIIGIPVFADGYSWYFKPQGNNRPMLCPEADFVDKYNTVTIGKENEKKVYLTFDAGYENGNVEKILDILKQNDVKGTFFVLPRLVENNTQLCVRMKEEGHLVGNHTVHHKNMGMIYDIDAFTDEIVPLEKFFHEKTGYSMDKLFRPPEGAFNESTLKHAEELGYATVFWSLAYADWDNSKQMNPEKALELLLSRTHNGCVLLLHPTSETNAAILDGYIKHLKQAGYEFCLVDELAKK